MLLLLKNPKSRLFFTTNNFFFFSHMMVTLSRCASSHVSPIDVMSISLSGCDGMTNSYNNLDHMPYILQCYDRSFTPPLKMSASLGYHRRLAPSTTTSMPSRMIGNKSTFHDAEASPSPTITILPCFLQEKPDYDIKGDGNVG